MVWCSTGVVPEWCSCGGVFLVVWCSTGVVLEWCFCGVWWCGGVFVVTGGVVVFVWWCFCFGVVVFLWWWCFCGGGGGGGVFVVVFLRCFCVFVMVFLYVFLGQGSTFVALPRSYAKSVDNTGVKRCLVLKFSFHCSYPH